MIKKLIKAYLPQIIGAALLAMALLAAWQYVSSLGYKAKASALQAQLATVQGDLTMCNANSSSRLAQIEAQNGAVDEAKRVGDARRKAAIEARDDAVKAMQDTQARYARLQADWPEDCVSAVDRVRQEFGL
jgi:acyl-coenzyme A synthetase/AMP-(fatty) acid ligase